MSRSYSTFNREVKQPFSDGLKKSTYSPMASSDHLHHPVDAGGRQFPVIRHGSNGETYVIKAEKIVEHRTHVPGSRILVSEYRPGKEELFRDYGVQDRHSPPVSTYLRPEKVEYTHIDGGFDRPEEVEEFLNKVLTEADRGSTRPVHVTLNPTRHPAGSIQPNVHERARKYSDERDGDDHRRMVNGSEPYLKNKGNYKDGNDFYERPQVKQNPNARNYQLSKPTNEIGPAIEFLKEAIKPCYANATVQTEANRQPIINWRNGSNRGTKMEANDYASKDDDEVLIEAGRGSTRPVPVPLTSTWHPVGSNRPIVHENTRKYSDERDFKGDDNRRMLNGSEPYLKNKGNYEDGHDFYERPQVNQSPNGRNYQLSKPTNEIGPAIEFLKGAIKPSYANGTVQTEANRQPIIKTAVPLATTNWRNGSTRGTKMEANDYDSEDDEEEEEEEEEEEDSRRNLHHYGKPLTTNRGGGGGLKPLENKEYGYEKPNNNNNKGINNAVNLGHTRFPPAGTTIQKKEENSYSPEKIDSKEAGRRYGKLPSRQPEDEKYKGTISSRDALVKYKGALVP